MSGSKSVAGSSASRRSLCLCSSASSAFFGIILAGQDLPRCAADRASDPAGNTDRRDECLHEHRCRSQRLHLDPWHGNRPGRPQPAPDKQHPDYAQLQNLHLLGRHQGSRPANHSGLLCCRSARPLVRPGKTRSAATFAPQEWAAMQPSSAVSGPTATSPRP